MTLDMSSQVLGAPPSAMTDDLRAEAEWLEVTEAMLDSRDAAYLTKRMAADRHRKARGFKTRRGGEVAPEDEAPF